MFFRRYSHILIPPRYNCFPATGSCDRSSERLSPGLQDHFSARSPCLYTSDDVINVDVEDTLK